MAQIDSEMALNLLLEDAERIKRLIRNQENSLCIAQCKAFEEVVDTQMYGLSRQVAFATRLGIVDNAAGQQLMADLEKDLNQLYSEVYEEQKSTEIGKSIVDIFRQKFPTCQIDKSNRQKTKENCGPT